MRASLIISQTTPPIEWTDLEAFSAQYGPKGAGLLSLPRDWTLPFVLFPALNKFRKEEEGWLRSIISTEELDLISELSEISGFVYVRSSILGETIWDRGRYESVIVKYSEDLFISDIEIAINKIIDSASGKDVAIVIQSYLEPRSKGEFGNLLRVSKTRDQWELTTIAGSTTSIDRLNSQRDQAASPAPPLEVKRGISRERLFGSIAAWLNSYLLRGISKNLNCEWVSDNRRIFLVQIDKEDEDSFGINPFQLIVEPLHHPNAVNGSFISCADKSAIDKWDKLIVLKELWSGEEKEIPMLFYVPFDKLPRTGDDFALNLLIDDFRNIIGPDNIVVRTSIAAGCEKIPNLRRTEGLTPDLAARWCLDTRDAIEAGSLRENEFAFIMHRFLAARSAAWARAVPNEAIVEIHSLWGLPDALQFCPYDTWEVHVPTGVVTEYPDYKSHILWPASGGAWQYLRIKNELGRSLSISSKEATDIASRTKSISERLGKACHVMWFVGCQTYEQHPINIPWYWTEAHDADKNLDRSNYRTVLIENKDGLDRFNNSPGDKTRCALRLSPKDESLIRDMSFIELVGRTAKTHGIPVILSGSPLAHAYFTLRRENCTVITLGSKEHSRVRRSATFGKLVRDKIPSRIASKKEAEQTWSIPHSMKTSFLISKLVEEVLEVRNAKGRNEKTLELADLYEVFRSIAQSEEITTDEIFTAAEKKKLTSGGFNDGVILVQTGIFGSGRQSFSDAEARRAQVLAMKTSSSSFEIPFSFFGFVEIDQPRTIYLDELNLQIEVTLRNDRIEIRAYKGREQLELPLDLVVT